ncbi:LptF/LptG family permease [bacterium]|jgi:lipopolysaccharide export system permease protein|nr:LptF/LptG family permease [bacterium]
MFQTLRLSEFVIVHHLPIFIVLKITLGLLFSFSPFVFPTAFLASVLVAFGRLSGESELTAMKASGLSAWRIAKPVYWVAGAAALMSWVCSMELAPWGERTISSTLLTAGSRKVISSIQPRSFTNGFYDLLLYADEVDKSENKLSHVFIYDERQAENPTVVIAKEGFIQNVATTNILENQVLLKLFDGEIHPLAKEVGSYDKMTFQEYALYLRVDMKEIADPGYPRMLSFGKLIENIRAKKSGTDMSTELWKRFSLSLSPLFFCMLGMGLGTIRARAATGSGVLYTFITAIVYWQLTAYFTYLGLRGTLHPALAMQIPNLVLLGAGYYFFRKTKD